LRASPSRSRRRGGKLELDTPQAVDDDGSVLLPPSVVPKRRDREL
jgi:hypothetical protein